MTKSIEETLNLPPIKDVLPEEDTEMDQVKEALQNSSAYDFDKSGEKKHIEEMDEVVKLAIESHKSILDFGFNVEAKDAGKIFAQAAAYLDIAVKASRSKADVKSKIISMQLERDRFEHESGQNVSEGQITSDSSGQGVVLTRDALLRQIREDKEENK